MHPMLGFGDWMIELTIKREIMGRESGQKIMSSALNKQNTNFLWNIQLQKLKSGIIYSETWGTI